MKKLKIIYLAAGRALHPDYDIIYQDIDGSRDLSGNMLFTDLNFYDVIIATPPCNFWSRARGNKLSDFSLKTMHLLPCIITKLLLLNKPFIVENVSNIKRFSEYDLFSFNCFQYKIGRHFYFTNVCLDNFINELISLQRQDFKYGGKVIKYDDMNSLYHQGGYNVYVVIEKFLQVVTNEAF